jgi:hypothetical protein
MTTEILMGGLSSLEKEKALLRDKINTRILVTPCIHFTDFFLDE